ACKTGHIERFSPTVARGSHDSAHYYRADPTSTPSHLDAECRLDRSANDVTADRAQFARSAQRPLNIIAVGHIVDAKAALGIADQKVVVDGHCETVKSALLVEPHQVVPESRKVGRPQSANDATMDH